MDMEKINNKITVFHNRLTSAIEKPTAVAMGFFDGVHRGHRQVIDAAAKYAKENGLALSVFTFQLGNTGKTKGKLLLSPHQKHEKLQELGVEYCFEPAFESFCNLPPEDFFTQMLLGEYNAKALFCGKDFFFGAERAGNVDLLEVLSKQHAVHLEVQPIELWQGQEISSSLIRNALEAGNIELANEMLGYPYEVDYEVQKGKQLGRTLGFPTINQILPEWRQGPQYGVYTTKTIIDGVGWPSTTGYGPRPTVNGLDPTCETFIPGFSGDLYGQNIKVQFFTREADIVKFDTLEELADAVQNWAEDAKRYFE